MLGQKAPAASWSPVAARWERSKWPQVLVLIKRVLIVDDMRDVSESIALLLDDIANGAFDIRTASHGAEALQLSAVWFPDAVVMDMEMPVMNGMQAAVKMRQQLAQPPLLVAMSGNPARLREGLASSAFDHAFAKPVDVDLLATTLGL